MTATLSHLKVTVVFLSLQSVLCSSFLLVLPSPRCGNTAYCCAAVVGMANSTCITLRRSEYGAVNGCTGSANASQKPGAFERIAAFGETLCISARYEAHCSSVEMLHVQLLEDVLRDGSLLVPSPSRSLLKDCLLEFGVVKSVLCPASAPTFVTLLGIIQYEGWPVTVTVSLHLATISNFTSVAATCVHVSAIPAIHMQ